MDQQEQTPERWWQRFRDEFARHLNDPCKGLGEARLRTAWSKEIARTQSYGGCLLVQVAAALGLEIRYEYGRDKVDWAMVDRTTGAPIILVESENTIQKAGDEIPKLCRGKSPLKSFQCPDSPLLGSRAGLEPGHLAWEALFRERSFLTATSFSSNTPPSLPICVRH